MATVTTNEDLLDELEAILDELDFRLSNYRAATGESRSAEDEGLVLACRSSAMLKNALTDSEHTRRVLESTPRSGGTAAGEES